VSNFPDVSSFRQEGEFRKGLRKRDRVSANVPDERADAKNESESERERGSSGVPRGRLMTRDPLLEPVTQMRGCPT